MKWQEIRARMRADLERLNALSAAPGGAVRCTPAHLCVVLYRVTQYFNSNGHRWLARVAWQLNHFLTAADLSPGADLGPGLVVVHPAAVMIHGRAGRNLTVVGRGGFGGGLSQEDIGAGPGFAWLGDDVTLDMGAMILGPQRIGDRVRVGPNCTVIQHLASDAVVMPLPVRLRTGEGAQA